MADGTNSTLHATASGTAHMAFTMIPAPNEPPKQAIFSNSKPLRIEYIL